jgi:hypothetical protein
MKSAIIKPLFSMISHFFRFGMTRMTSVHTGVMQIAPVSSQPEAKNMKFVGMSQKPP